MELMEIIAFVGILMEMEKQFGAMLGIHKIQQNNYVTQLAMLTQINAYCKMKS